MIYVYYEDSFLCINIKYLNIAKLQNAEFLNCYGIEVATFVTMQCFEMSAVDNLSSLMDLTAAFLIKGGCQMAMNVV